MKLSTIKIIGGLTISIFATAATAECTQEDVQQRMTLLTTGMLVLAETDTAKMQQITVSMQESMAAATESGDQDAVCISLDESIAILEE